MLISIQKKTVESYSWPLMLSWNVVVVDIDETVTSRKKSMRVYVCMQKKKNENQIQMPNYSCCCLLLHLLEERLQGSYSTMMTVDVVAEETDLISSCSDCSFCCASADRRTACSYHKTTQHRHVKGNRCSKLILVVRTVCVC